MNKSVRTVQRWEEEFSLPVRRPNKPDAGTVLAFSEELDLWMQQHTMVRAVEELHHEVDAIGRHPAITQCIDRLRSSSMRAHDVRRRSKELMRQTEELLANVQRQMLRLQVAVDKGQRLYKDLVQVKQPQPRNGNSSKTSRLAS